MGYDNIKDFVGRKDASVNWLRRFMAGRYGVDQLTWVLLGVSLVLSLLSRILQAGIFGLLCWAVLFYCYFRILSRNIYARQQENQKLMQFWYRLKNNGGTRRTIQDRKENKVFVCPTCKQKLRVPRGKGKINITCPKCHTSFIKKT